MNWDVWAIEHRRLEQETRLLEHNDIFSDKLWGQNGCQVLTQQFVFCGLRKIKPNVNEKITQLWGSRYSKQVISGVV